ncbi:unnamed protein product [Laminaria digitata]
MLPAGRRKICMYLEHISWVGSVLYRSYYTTAHNGSSDLDDLDRDMCDVWNHCSLRADALRATVLFVREDACYGGPIHNEKWACIKYHAIHIGCKSVAHKFPEAPTTWGALYPHPTTHF